MDLTALLTSLSKVPPDIKREILIRTPLLIVYAARYHPEVSSICTEEFWIRRARERYNRELVSPAPFQEITGLAPGSPDFNFRRYLELLTSHIPYKDTFLEIREIAVYLAEKIRLQSENTGPVEVFIYSRWSSGEDKIVILARSEREAISSLIFDNREGVMESICYSIMGSIIKYLMIDETASFDDQMIDGLVDSLKDDRYLKKGTLLLAKGIKLEN